MNIIEDTKVKTTCYHCGEDVHTGNYHLEDKNFCCRGCQTVYEIINKNNLCSYYDLEKAPGINQKQRTRKGKFDLLSDETVTNQLVHFKQDNIFHVQLYLPQMHCSSCVWILEHLNKLDKGIVKSTVNFLKKEVTVQYDTQVTNLTKVAEVLADIGYEPHISLNDSSKKSLKKTDTTRVVKIGIAGFCFGNIMMLSFPEYFSLGIYEDAKFSYWFNYLNLILSLPVLLYSASEFFASAVKSYKQKFLNIDTPIALAIAITFSRSVYEIITASGSGYLDSMSGIVFFMLIGRYFQNRTYQSISFDRDFSSYFPLGVTRIEKDNTEHQIPVTDLKTGDRIKIFNDEIIPADSILFFGKATIDYSFVTGEATPIQKGIGEIVYAGGKQTSGAIEMEVVKEVSKSYLTQLWNNQAFKKDTSEEDNESFIHTVSKYFTYALFSIAITSAIYWQLHNPAKVWSAVTAVLIVACPCALLLSASFTNGNMIQQLNKFKFYVKNNLVIERMAGIDTIVFDKTGTITQQQIHQVEFFGDALTNEEEQLIRTLAAQSNHPLSKAIVYALPAHKNLLMRNYEELKGHGICAYINDKKVALGSSTFVLQEKTAGSKNGSRVYVSIDNHCLGFFEIKNNYRTSLVKVVASLKPFFKLNILSGDNDAERANLQEIFGKETEMLFNQKPEDKLLFIQKLQSEGKKVAMMGDGLNDAGALKQSDVGIAISDNTNNFSPACDVIMSGDNFYLLSEVIQYCRKQKSIIYASFILSILYNIVGLYFAVQGTLEPVIAAILMPVSSISIVLLTTGMSSWFSYNIKRKIDKSHR